jgi:hypothetical protein
MPTEPLGKTSFLFSRCLDYAVSQVGTLLIHVPAGASSLPEGTQLHHLLCQRSHDQTGSGTFAGASSLPWSTTSSVSECYRTSGVWGPSSAESR